MGCYDFPRNIDADTAQNGTPIYPVVISMLFEHKSKWVKVGESYFFNANARIGNVFQSSNDWIPVIPLVDSRELVETKFSLYAPNFVFSPANQETQKFPMGLHISAEQDWVIAPIDGANGTQSLAVSIEGDNFYYQNEFELDVRNILGIDPKLLAIILPIGSVIAFLLTQTKTLTGIFQIDKEKTRSRKGDS